MRIVFQPLVIFSRRCFPLIQNSFEPFELLDSDRAIDVGKTVIITEFRVFKPFGILVASLISERFRPLRTGIALGTAALVTVGGLRLLAGFDLLDLDPFGSERTERVDPAVLTALSDADELRAATAELEVVVEVEDDTRFLPDVLSGQQTTFLAAGTVDAIVDLGAAVIKPTADGGVVVSLPMPVLDGVHVDSERSRVLDRDRGFFDRVGDAFTDDPDDDSDLYLLAEDELVRAAADTELLTQAQDSARTTVVGLLNEAGVADVMVVFATPEVPADR